MGLSENGVSSIIWDTRISHHHFMFTGVLDRTLLKRYSVASLGAHDNGLGT